jgi:serine/threonine-protein kinase
MPIDHFGEFELIEELGRGDLGIVYKARDLTQNRFVAFKLLCPRARAIEDGVSRFWNEARVAAWLDHPRIVPVYACGSHNRGFWISMKLIRGASLGRKLGDFIGDWRAAARLVKTLAEAVRYAHQRGTLHLNLKPANVLIDEFGDANLTGFSLNAKFAAKNDLTQGGAILGTPAYMAPEQSSGHGESITTAIDVYGLGAILHALITGNPPFGGNSPAETLSEFRDRTPDPFSMHDPRIPRDLQIIVLKCLEHEPRRRYHSADALADDLGRYLNGEPIRAT